MKLARLSLLVTEPTLSTDTIDPPIGQSTYYSGTMAAVRVKIELLITYVGPGEGSIELEEEWKENGNRFSRLFRMVFSARPYFLGHSRVL